MNHTAPKSKHGISIEGHLFWARGGSSAHAYSAHSESTQKKHNKQANKQEYRKKDKLHSQQDQAKSELKRFHACSPHVASEFVQIGVGSFQVLPHQPIFTIFKENQI